MELISKGLWRGQQLHVLAFSCIGSENRCAGKAEQVIILERLDNLSVHISKLAAVAFVKDDNAMLAEHLVSLVFRDKVVQLLDGGDDDFILVVAAFFVPVLKLPLQHSGRSVAVGRAFFKAVIFLHGLIVQVFSIHYKQNLVHIRKCGSKLCGLEGSQGFAASCGVPDVSSGIQRSHPLVVGGYLDAVQDALGRCNLIGTHDHQNFFCCENTILGQHIQNRVLGKEGFRKINQVCNYLIVAICPEGSKFKAVAGFLGFLFCSFAHLFDVAVSGGVGVILGMGSIRDNENLHILIQAACRPEAVSLVAFDLIKGFPNSNAPALQLHMDEGQTVDHKRYIIACVVLAFGFLILVDDLQTVVVNVLFVDQLNILRSSVIPAEYLYMIRLDGTAFFNDAFVGIGKGFCEETLPLAVSKGIVVQKRELPSEVGDQTAFVMDGKILIPLRGQQPDELLFQSRFALKAVRA